MACWRVAVTCWLVPAAAASYRHGTRCSRRPCSGPCTWRCTSGDGEGARLRSGPRPAPPPRQRIAHAPRPHRVAQLVRVHAQRPPRRVRAQTPPAPRVYLLRIVQGAPRLPDALPEALVRHPLWGHASPQLRRRPPAAPATLGPPPPPRTCSSSCALATAICTFTCSMISPGSSFPPPELPKSEPKPPSMAPQSQPDSGSVCPPAPTPEVGHRTAPREMASERAGGRDYSSNKAARVLPRMRRQGRTRVGFPCRAPGRRAGHGTRGPPLRAQAPPRQGSLRACARGGGSVYTAPWAVGRGVKPGRHVTKSTAECQCIRWEKNAEN